MINPYADLYEITMLDVRKHVEAGASFCREEWEQLEARLAYLAGKANTWGMAEVKWGNVADMMEPVR